MKQLIKALNKVTESDLKWNRETKTHDEIEVHPPVFEKDGHVYISAESEESFHFADYYGEFSCNLPWVNPKLDEIANKFGGYWEWQNPGCLMFCEY